MGDIYETNIMYYLHMQQNWKLNKNYNKQKYTAMKKFIFNTSIYYIISLNRWTVTYNFEINKKKTMSITYF